MEHWYLFRRDLLLIIHIGFVAKHQHVDILISIALDFIEPEFLDVFKRLLASGVVHNYNTRVDLTGYVPICSFIVGIGDGPETFLPCCIPDL
jgi:hypothetical protein